ncbi:hypothetical protein [Corynebacterium aquilae]|uniref:hypothetical protein n=1 Tax=Corynebacterium aquilae TaxID=203263 RepID=UPI001FE284F0|nr:hypothetical protein [Corynebacterium aquilae]
MAFAVVPVVRATNNPQGRSLLAVSSVRANVRPRGMRHAVNVRNGAVRLRGMIVAVHGKPVVAMTATNRAVSVAANDPNESPDIAHTVVWMLPAVSFSTYCARSNAMVHTPT